MKARVIIERKASTCVILNHDHHDQFPGLFVHAVASFACSRSDLLASVERGDPH